MGIDLDSLNKLIENNYNEISSINGKSLRKVGRPKKNIIKDKVVKVYLNKFEKQILEEYILKNNITSSELLSGFIRKLK